MKYSYMIWRLDSKIRINLATVELNLLMVIKDMKWEASFQVQKSQK